LPVRWSASRGSSWLWIIIRGGRRGGRRFLIWVWLMRNRRWWLIILVVWWFWFVCVGRKRCSFCLFCCLPICLIWGLRFPVNIFLFFPRTVLPTGLLSFLSFLAVSPVSFFPAVLLCCSCLLVFCVVFVPMTFRRPGSGRLCSFASFCYRHRISSFISLFALGFTFVTLLPLNCSLECFFPFLRF
jgi:hypothetical protein